MLFDRCYPKITDWLFDVSNQAIDLRVLPLYSYGFWVAMGFLVAAILLGKELKRREALGLFQYTEKEVHEDGVDYFSFMVAAVVGYLVGSKGVGYMGLTINETLAGIVGAVIVLGGRLAYFLKTKPDTPSVRIERVYPSDLVGDLVILAGVFGVTGSIFFNYLESPEDYVGFWNDPVSYLFSGLSVYGGLICAGIAILIFAYRKKINVPNLFDSLAIVFILANGVGRIGCQVSGDGDWGIVNPHTKPSFIPQFLWANTYPHNIIDEGVPITGCMEPHCMQLAEAVYPTPIYEFLMCTAIFLILYLLRKRFTPMPGMLIFLFFIFIGIERFLIEKIRDLGARNLYYTPFGGFKQSELISIALFVVGVLGCIWTWYYYKKVRAKVE